MKKNTKTIFAVVISVSLMAFTFSLNEGDKTPCNIVIEYSDFYYGLNSRFEPITKNQLQSANTVADFFSSANPRPLNAYESVEVVIIENDKKTDKRLSNESNTLSEAQKSMLQNLGYSEHFLISTYFEGINRETGKPDYKRAEPHFTVVPEKQAAYELGEKTLIDYLASGNKENTGNLDEDKLQFAKLYFTITHNGKITNVYLDRTSGYEKIDVTMIELLTTAPGKWIPAQNAQGEHVAQELTITFGVGGC